MVLIESDWNLKYVARIKSVASAKPVLIESDWNLKFIRFSKICDGLLVLIESDWNLKEDLATADNVNDKRINRLRLEFKGNEELSGIVDDLSINRIRLEFKDHNYVTDTSDCTCINRFRLEFKDDPDN